MWLCLFVPGACFLRNYGKISYPCCGPPPPLEWKGSGFRFRRMEMVDMTITRFQFFENREV